MKFHNGEPFDAQSVKATMDYIKDPANKTHYAPRWAQVKEVQIVNDYTVRFITEKPWPGLIDRIAGSDFLPMPPKALKEQGVAGAGRQADRHRALQLRAVGARREAGGGAQPRLLAGPAEASRVTFRFIPEFSARLAALLAGEIDIMKDVPPQNVEMLEKSGKAQAARHRLLPHQLPGAGQPQAGADAGHPGAEGDQPRHQRRRADPAGAQGPGHQDVRLALADQRGLFPEAPVLEVRPGAGPGPLQGSGRGSDQAPAHARHALGALSARQGHLARHRRAAPARRHQDQRGGQRVGHAPRQDQEPHDRRHVLPGLGARAGRAEHHRTALPSASRPTRPTATTRRSRPRSTRR